MNLPFFISKRLFTTKESNNNYTKPIIHISILAISLSVAIMLLSIIILTGFKKQIIDKVVGFNSHIQISSFTDNQSYETTPINKNQDFYADILNQEGFEHIQIFATKAGIIKTKDEIHGVVLKGVSNDFNKQFFEGNLISGFIPNYHDSLASNDIVISKSVVNLLDLKLDDYIFIYFVQDPPRVRKLKIAGIYETGFSDFDDLIVIADIRHIQKLNNWDSQNIGGFEVFISNFNHLERQTHLVYEKTGYQLISKNIKELYPEVFDWLDLQDINIKVIIFLMILVGLINMITVLLIMILEKTQLIGMLKALGADNWQVRKIFIYNALYLIVNGLIWGNIIALGLSFLQKRFSLISLDPNTYYMSAVPVYFDFSSICLLNLAVFFVCWMVLFIPSVVITKISPIKSIRFQ